ncbi:MAG: guanine nucleotide-binding protein subunit alpha [Bogoriella megaspora]|nr:MAG: guanine nucleotide-binding protein subunit alpha [Bogoriella megaspora]
MDPASIIGIVGSVVSVADIVTRSIRRLSSLAARFRDAPFLISTLIGQLCTVQAALDQLACWANDDLAENPRYSLLAMRVGSSLKCFSPLIVSLQHQLDQVEEVPENQFSLSKRISFLWTEPELERYLTLLDRQVNALTLLLQAIQWYFDDHNLPKHFTKSDSNSIIDQNAILDDEDNQTILRLAKDCTSSLVGLDDVSKHDSASFLSDNTADLSTSFDFDGLLMASKIYQAAHRSQLRRLVIARKDRSLPTSRHPKKSENSPEQHRVQANINLENAKVALETCVDRKSNTNGQIQGAEDSCRNETSAVVNDLRSPSSHYSKFPWRKLAPTRTRNVDLPWKTKFGSTNAVNEQKLNDSSDPLPLKVLILGISESGKTTLNKILKLARGHYGFDVDYRQSYKEIVFSNVVTGMRILLDAMTSLDIHLENGFWIMHHTKTISMAPIQMGESALPAEITAAIDSLWTDAGLQACFSRRREFQLFDGWPFFASQVKRIGADGYVPSTQDVLYARTKTTGIDRAVYEFDGTTYQVFDVGGVRSERNRWSQCFDDVDAILFTVDSVAYEKRLFEDESQNRMQEQLDLWESIVNGPWFSQTSFVLIFTRADELN